MLIKWMLTLTMLMSSAAAWSHDEAQGTARSKPTPGVEETAFGKPGDRAKVTRTVQVRMSDNMRFMPAMLSVAHGETIRFVVSNEGKVMHEMVLGTAEALKEHAALMKKLPGMEHDEPYMVHVAPGTTGEIIWQFSRAGTVHFGCLIPGHFEAGMVGKVEVRK